MTTTEIAVRQPGAVAERDIIDGWILMASDVFKLASHICETDFVPAAYRGNAPAVAASILTGRELGIGPMTSLRHVQVVKGVPGLSAEYKRARVLSAGHEFAILEWTNTRCRVKGRRRGSPEPPLEVTYTMDDAKLAGLLRPSQSGKPGAWQTRPRRMLFARAGSDLCDALFSDVVNGLPTAELLTEGTDDDAFAGYDESARQEAEPKPAARTAQRRQAKPAQTSAAAVPDEKAPGGPAAAAGPDQPPLPGEDEPTNEDTERAVARAQERVNRMAADEPAASGGATPGLVGIIRQHFVRLGFTDDEKGERLDVTSEIAGRSVGSTNELTQAEAKAVADTLSRCLPAKALIQTDQGSIQIRDIVKKRLPVKVRSIDLATGRECWQPVVNWWQNGLTAEWVRIWAPSGRFGAKPLRVTPNHHIWTPAGWREAGDLMPGDLVAAPSPVLSPEQEQVILGSLLGDGSLASGKSEISLPRFVEAHGASQLAYLDWKCAALASLGVKRWSGMQCAGNGLSYESHKMWTRAVPSLYRYRGAKPEDILGDLGDLGLAVWFMDDGNFNLNGRGPRASSAIYCCGFSPEFADAACAWLGDRYGISAWVRRRDHYPNIAINTAGTQRLEELLSPWIRRNEGRKEWVAAQVPQGHDGFAFVPVTATERIARPKREYRYDIEVAGTHTFIAGGMVVSNCKDRAQLALITAPKDEAGDD